MCRKSYAKIMQIECRTSNLFECYAEMPLILCKGNYKKAEYKESCAYRIISVLVQSLR